MYSYNKYIFKIQLIQHFIILFMNIYRFTRYVGLEVDIRHFPALWVVRCWTIQFEKCIVYPSSLSSPTSEILDTATFWQDTPE